LSAADLQCDVAIIGGGLAGSALAQALAPTPLRTILVEARDPATLQQPSFDDRATALANGSQRILTGLGVWDALRPDAQAIDSIHISERGRFGAARISAAAEGVPALGYLAENRLMGRALWSALSAAPRFQCLAPATLVALHADAEAAVADIALGERRIRLRAKLLVAADGARSQVRDVLGIGASADDYAQCAVVLNGATEMPHTARAYERFTRDGPLAVLPLPQERVAVVWTLSRAAAQRVMQLDEPAFRSALQEAFGYRLGRFRRLGLRASYPLLRIRSASSVAARTVLIGSAAVHLHPVAGQGFNLALRDVAALAEVLSDTVMTSGVAADPGATGVLERYRDWRRRDQARVAAFTHGLIRFFGFDCAPLTLSRGLGLMLFDLLPGAKTLLARHSMGLSGYQPRLARGLPLTPVD
jgi:2-octaprenyl-6-methoxyphenol hydroxylase